MDLDKRQNKGRRVDDAVGHCDSHIDNSSAIEDHGTQLAEIRGSVNVGKYILSGIGAVVIFTASIGVSIFGSYMDKLNTSMAGVASEVRTFVLSSSTDRAGIRVELQNLRNDIDEIKRAH
jgi:hypothetical protein